MTITIQEIINMIIGGGLLGALGQGVRTTVGLKKFNEENTAKVAENKPEEEFSVSRMVISFIIGFVAGALAMLIKGKIENYTTETIVTIIAAGYSGADFIEGVFNTYIKKVTPPGNDANAEAGVKNLAQIPNEQPLFVADEADFSNTPSQG